LRYVAGVDGGGSKTRFVIADEAGKVMADISNGSSNHQMIGIIETERVLRSLYEEAIEIAGISDEEIEVVYLGLAGADMESDFEILERMLSRIFKKTKTVLANDTWPILRSGTPGKWGAAVICGTGANAAAVNPVGEHKILRALGYSAGGAGGGYEMAMTALHWAFRSDEGTTEKSMLTEALPNVLGLSNMNEVLKKIYPEFLLESTELALVASLVFELANQGDSICQKILIEAGTELGEMLGGLLRKLGMENLEVPVVFGGSVMGGNNPLMRDQLKTTVHRVAPYADFLFPRLVPAGGAVLLALEEIGICTEPTIHDELVNYLGLHS